MARMNTLVIYAQVQFCFAKDILVLCDEVPTACIISQLCGSNDNAILQRTVTKTKRTS